MKLLFSLIAVALLLTLVAPQKAGARHYRDADRPVSSQTQSYRANALRSTPPSNLAEPGTLALLGTGLIGLASLVRRRFQN